MARLKAPVKTE